MTYYLEIKTADGDTITKPYRTLSGATNAGCRKFKVPGYQAVNRTEGSYPCVLHVVAEWKRDGAWIGRVWS